MYFSTNIQKILFWYPKIHLCYQLSFSTIKNSFSNTVSVDYSLHDPSDTSEYSSVQYFTDGAMNPCVDSTFDFFDKVMSTVKQYHAAAGVPLKLMHLAGDEVASGAWINSTACSRLLEVSNAPQGERTLLLLNGILKVLVPFLTIYLCT